MARREYWRLVDNQGRPPGMMGMWPSRAVTFIENHDTGGWLHWAGGLVKDAAHGQQGGLMTRDFRHVSSKHTAPGEA